MKITIDITTPEAIAIINGLRKPTEPISDPRCVVDMSELCGAKDTAESLREKYADIWDDVVKICNPSAPPI